MRIEIPGDVRLIIETLNRGGHEAFAVGGCVRDTMLGREPQDWDITTSARPEEVKALFRRTVDTGIQHGTVTVMLNHVGYEVTTYRIDGKYSDSRHPESVTFTPELSEDLKRRDFTINAMAYNDAEGVQDLFGGQDDLRRKIIRAVGDPEARFGEDALRIMRCIRFAAQLGFDIEPATYEAAKKLAGTLSMISRERIRDEFLKTLMSDHPDHVGLLAEIGALKEILPGGELAERELVLAVLKSLPKDRILRLAEFFMRAAGPGTIPGDRPGADAGASPDGKTVVSQDEHAEAAERCLMDLRFDNETLKQVVQLVKFGDRPVPENETDTRRLMNLLGNGALEAHFTLGEAEAQARGDAETVRKIGHARELQRKIIEAGDCTSMGELAVKGGDLISRGMRPGKQMGAVLNRLLQAVLEDPALNEKETLLKLAFEDLPSEKRS